MGFGVSRLRAQCLHLGIQAALVASGLVLVNDALIGHAVDDRYGAGISGLGCLRVTAFYGSVYFLDLGAHQGAQAGVVGAAPAGVY